MANNLQETIEGILGQPATHATGRYGLPKTSEVIDYEMSFTKEGKKYLVEAILQAVRDDLELKRPNPPYPDEAQRKAFLVGWFTHEHKVKTKLGGGE